jgi:hypothetical protein
VSVPELRTQDGWPLGLAATPRSPRQPRADGTTIVFPFVLTYAGLGLYLFSPHRDAYWAAIISLVTFSVMPAMLSGVRPTRNTTICPLNWTLLAFALQLVVVPVLLCYLGPYQNTLPALPSSHAINVALLMVTVGYAMFCAGYHSAHTRTTRRVARGVWRVSARWRVQSPLIVFAYLTLGLVGFYLTFSDLHTVLSYFGQSKVDINTTADRTSRALGTVFRPFAGFAVILVWCLWIEKRRPRRSLGLVLGTAVAAAMVLMSYATFSYNRAAFVAPIVTLLAVYSAWVRRITFRTLLILGVVGLVLLTAFQAYRTSGLSLQQAIGSERGAVSSRTDINAELQVYANAPQYLGFLLEKTQYGRSPDYGRSLSASLLSPVPKLGARFRSKSGTAKFNRMIYGDLPAHDQIIPFAGELFMNFYWAGVILGYVLLGAAVAALQRGFLAAPTAVQAFAWQYAAVWVASLVLGGILPVSQFFVSFFWPVIVLSVRSTLTTSASKRASYRRAVVPAPR